MTFKTLKDIEKCYWEEDGVLIEDLRQEAIKWIKEDLRIINQNPLLSIERIMAIKFVNIWMERLNITEEDLK